MNPLNRAVKQAGLRRRDLYSVAGRNTIDAYLTPAELPARARLGIIQAIAKMAGCRVEVVLIPHCTNGEKVVND